MKFLAINFLFLCKTLSLIYLDSSYSQNDSDGTYAKPFSEFGILNELMSNNSDPLTICIKNIISIPQAFIFENRTLIFSA